MYVRKNSIKKEDVIFLIFNFYIIQSNQKQSTTIEHNYQFP